MTNHDEVRGILLNVLDRAAASDVPFWEASAEDRERISNLVGSPTMSVPAGDVGDAVAGSRTPFLAVAVLSELAIAALVEQGGAVTREEAIFRLREKVADHLGDDSEG